MDGMKLAKWRKDFEKEISSVQAEFNAFFVDHKPEEFYTLKVDEESQNLSLEFKHQNELPQEIEKRMIKLLYQTQPEDSI